MALKANSSDQEVFYAEVPLAFQSALAGILLASELIIHAGSLRNQSIPNITSIDLLQPLSEHVLSNVGKHSSKRCLCQDADYITVYERKYPDM